MWTGPEEEGRQRHRRAVTMAASAAAASSVKVVVTGGKGFLGRYLCQTLLRRRRVSGRPLDTLAILDAGADTQVSCGA